MLKFLKKRLGEPASLIFDTASLNGLGGRLNQEDALAYCSINPQAACWIVADGVGGQEAGEVASQLAVTTILREFRANPRCSGKNMSQLLEAAHRAVFSARLSRPASKHMATTAAVLIVDHHRAVWGHVGDSRLYHFRDGKLLQRTSDQSLINMMLECGALSEDDMADYPQRNVILHALGQDNTPQYRINGPVTIQAGDGFLLCTDGVWELMSDRELLETWQARHSAAAWLAEMQVGLESRVADKNSSGKPADNYSALLVKVFPHPEL